MLAIGRPMVFTFADDWPSIAERLLYSLLLLIKLEFSSLAVTARLMYASNSQLDEISGNQEYI